MALSRLLLVFASIAMFGHRGATQQFIESAEGRVEVIGLKRWTAAMLADSLGLHVPGVSLFQTKECTKALTGKLHFSSVFIDKMIFAGQEGKSAQSVIIRLVEPQDSGRIVWRAEPRDSGRVQMAWRDLALVLGDSAMTYFHEGEMEPLQVYGNFLQLGSDSALKKIAFMPWNRARTLLFWKVLKRHNAAKDRDLAIRVLQQDGNRRNRMMAAAILANFPNEDVSWRALADAVRDSYTGVNRAAIMSLQSLANSFARPVDWAPSAHGIRAILDGTNIAEFMSFTRVLVQTSVAPALAPTLLKGGGELIVAHADANDRRSHELAIALLTRLSGRPAIGTDWRTWIGSL